MNCNIPEHNFHSISVYGLKEAFFPRRIFCVGANYSKHVQEMGLPGRENPFYFMKPSESIVQSPPSEVAKIPFPNNTDDYHHEVELVVVIGKEGSNIAVESAHESIFGLAVGLDMTKRDLQKKLREKKQPWEISKSFDYSAPLGLIHPFDIDFCTSNLEISLKVNGVTKQKSNTSNMIFSVNEIISNLSEFFRLQPGDLIYTGTPEGVGSVFRGDVLSAEISGLSKLEVEII